MAQSNFVYTQETVRSTAQARRECAAMVRRTRFEMVEIRSSARTAIIESRELMAEADAILAKRYRAVPHAKKPEPPTPESWDVYKIAKRAVWLGVVEAPDKQAAVEKAAQEFKTEVWRLYAVARQ
jgi:hypothetical protein